MRREPNLPFQVFGDETAFAGCVAGTETAGESHAIGSVVRFGDETQLAIVGSDTLP